MAARFRFTRQVYCSSAASSLNFQVRRKPCSGARMPEPLAAQAPVPNPHYTNPMARPPKPTQVQSAMETSATSLPARGESRSPSTLVNLR